MTHVDIVHVDDSIIVVNKPAGLPVLPDGWAAESPYLVQMLKEEFGTHSNALEGDIWIVHRLDKATSGVLVFARTAEAHRDLNRQLEEHEAEKVYHAIILGVPSWEVKTAKHPLRLDVGHKHRTAVDHRHGKPAETRFKILERYKAHALVEALLMTGRTHQIRAHAYALEHPLLGDTLYGAPTTEIIDRPALHALRLTITHPATGQRETYTAPYPADFTRALKKLKFGR
jgi:RluA family pseudouridine synthase